MSKVVIDDSKLVNIADAIRNKNGSANKYTPTEMATAIGDIKVSTGAELAPEDLVLSGNCEYKFTYKQWTWFIEKFGDKITTKDIIEASYMFKNSSNILSIPFDINFSINTEYGGGNNVSYMFEYCQSLQKLPYLKNYIVYDTDYMFSHCEKITEIPEDYFDTWDFSTVLRSKNIGSVRGMFSNCYRLRKIPSDLSMFYLNYDYNKNSFFYGGPFNNCYVLDELTNLPVPPIATSNYFGSTFYQNCRLKKITFSLNDGMPKTASWQNQVIDLTPLIGYTSQYSSLKYYGVPIDAEITDDTSYQLLKDNEDSWTSNIKYSRYNHDSAVETINTLPDTSAYLAESGGTTNIIKFKGASGSATDGGAINTLTEAEIAVAAAKGWTVTLV